MPRKSSKKETLLKKTGSVCPECLRPLSAEVFERDGKVWIRKTCPEHGTFEDLYWGSYEMYKRASEDICKMQFRVSLFSSYAANRKNDRRK